MLDLGGDQIQDLVEDMRAPVGERATGDALIGVPQVARVSEPADERLDVEDVTEGTCSHSASHREVVGVEPSVLVDDNQPVECVGLSKDDICLVGVDRERLLNHNVLAGADGAKCPGRVGAGWGGHHDEVDVVTFEQLVGVAQDDDSVSNGRRRGQPGGEVSQTAVSASPSTARTARLCSCPIAPYPSRPTRTTGASGWTVMWRSSCSSARVTTRSSTVDARVPTVNTDVAVDERQVITGCSARPTWAVSSTATSSATLSTRVTRSVR